MQPEITTSGLNSDTNHFEYDLYWRARSDIRGVFRDTQRPFPGFVEAYTRGATTAFSSGSLSYVSSFSFLTVYPQLHHRKFANKNYRRCGDYYLAHEVTVNKGVNKRILGRANFSFQRASNRSPRSTSWQFILCFYFRSFLPESWVCINAYSSRHVMWSWEKKSLTAGC